MSICPMRISKPEGEEERFSYINGTNEWRTIKIKDDR